MAYSIIQEPGSKYGPCEGDMCDHIDCAGLRTVAASVCRLCVEPIGYGVEYCKDPDDEDRHVHFWCLQGEAERSL